LPGLITAFNTALTGANVSIGATRSHFPILYQGGSDRRGQEMILRLIDRASRADPTLSTTVPILENARFARRFSVRAPISLVAQLGIAGQESLIGIRGSDPIIASPDSHWQRHPHEP